MRLELKQIKLDSEQYFYDEENKEKHIRGNLSLSVDLIGDNDNRVSFIIPLEVISTNKQTGEERDTQRDLEAQIYVEKF